MGRRDSSPCNPLLVAQSSVDFSSPCGVPAAPLARPSLRLPKERRRGLAGPRASKPTAIIGAPTPFVSTPPTTGSHRPATGHRRRGVATDSWTPTRAGRALPERRDGIPWADLVPRGRTNCTTLAGAATTPRRRTLAGRPCRGRDKSVGPMESRPCAAERHGPGRVGTSKICAPCEARRGLLTRYRPVSVPVSESLPWCLGALVPSCLGAFVPWCLRAFVPSL